MTPMPQKTARRFVFIFFGFTVLLAIVYGLANALSGESSNPVKFYLLIFGANLVNGTMVYGIRAYSISRWKKAGKKLPDGV